MPNLFFTDAVQKIGSLAELKTVLHVFWLLSRRRGYPQYVSAMELIDDPVLVSGFNETSAEKSEMVQRALEDAVGHGILLQVKTDKAGSPQDIYMINNESGREVIEKIAEGKLPHLFTDKAASPAKMGQPINIFSLYEHNVGVLTPLIAEQLKEAEKLYPADWIEAAFKEAASLNKRSWKYILRILERWSIEGKDNGKFGRDTEKEIDRQKYVRGKYGHMVKG